ncbi:MULTISPECIES: lasso peptide isopeptide bond-forming cyclase [Streptomyces]|uniref:asparagine synthase (glutamine-hydrolyzing) n=1 Tax=Streptomyces koelreuteriae TaxID=2838015 RepID=A0ABX8FZW9_9ACTN|nr:MULTISPECIES: lasso peptide isopeptide bond-forming cyclase [Streptomyces]QWB26794.1 lasso peptide isopeptide bond-forming cyclase [Streptomyces koelreuteriae]UUA09876.1 lasso peptide isopeptide bond-forming cyclase [Streptomyces koelreuteriae]UUA17481.1 lasso peptide isopeptide bond-forming cyclase [Streptomyces sp. CRCS-T-1]
MSSTGFVVLPDTAAAADARAAAPWASPEEFSHHSGRPWLVGRWSPGEITVVTAGPVRVAAVGVCPVSATRLSSLAARIRTVSDADALATSLPGSCHLVVSAGGEVRFQGSATGLRRVFRTRVHGVEVAADRADVLAAMTGAGIDEQALALRVATGGFLPPPLGDRPLWSGISPLAPDHALVWERDRVHETRWWQPPAPELSLATGAEAVREALTSALRDRGPDRGRLSTDLSGGMDSTSLCFLAARHAPDLVTFRWGEAEAGNDDAAFAAHAIASLDRAEHLVVPPGELPALFTDAGEAVDTEEPYPFVRTLARTRHTARLLAASGSRRHLAGHGGDELFTPFPGYLHALLRRRPLTALRHVRGYGALKRWPVLPTLAALSRPGDEAAWWRTQADLLTAPPPPRRRPALGWGLWTLRAPTWATGTATDAAREALRDTATRVQPLSDDLAQHQSLLAMRASAPWYRLLARVFADDGVQLDSPFFDDRVVEAVLAVRAHEHAGPWRYKPLLAEAMRGIVPEAVLGRSTKGEFSDEANSGLRRNLPAILDMFEDSALAAHGLIDPGELRTRLLAPQPDNSARIALEPLIGCETWLRAATRPAPAWRFEARASAS